MLSLSKRYYKEFYESKLKMLDKASENFYSKADIDRKRASVMKVMEKLQEDMTKNVCEIPFDDLGINTMFVDEGFGSLDEESLSLAISTLQELTEGDRLVGIISHVAELKEKIDKQIIVTKERSGGSRCEIAVG